MATSCTKTSLNFKKIAHRHGIDEIISNTNRNGSIFAVHWRYSLREDWSQSESSEICIVGTSSSAAVSKSRRRTPGEGRLSVSPVLESGDDGALIKPGDDPNSRRRPHSFLALFWQGTSCWELLGDPPGVWIRLHSEGLTRLDMSAISLRSSSETELLLLTSASKSLTP